MALAVLAPLGAGPTPAQQAPRTLEPADVATFGVAAALYLGSRLVHFAPDFTACAPCDRDLVPIFDRWAIAEFRPGWSTASWASELALAGAVVVDLARRTDGGPHVTAALGSVGWAFGATELIKGAVGRRRPVLYTSAAPVAVFEADNHRSFPSGHASVAMALATTYWLSVDDLGEPTAAGERWVAFGAATATALMRVVAGKHFPSDVFVGTVLGVLSATAVHAIKF